MALVDLIGRLASQIVDARMSVSNGTASLGLVYLSITGQPVSGCQDNRMVLVGGQGWLTGQIVS